MIREHSIVDKMLAAAALAWRYRFLVHSKSTLFFVLIETRMHRVGLTSIIYGTVNTPRDTSGEWSTGTA